MQRARELCQRAFLGHLPERAVCYHRGRCDHQPHPSVAHLHPVLFDDTTAVTMLAEGCISVGSQRDNMPRLKAHQLLAVVVQLARLGGHLVVLRLQVAEKVQRLVHLHGHKHKVKSAACCGLVAWMPQS